MVPTSIKGLMGAIRLETNMDELLIYVPGSRFPSICPCCLNSTEERHNISRIIFLWVSALVTNVRNIPFCSTCWEKRRKIHEKRNIFTIAVMLVLGAIFFGIGFVVYQFNSSLGLLVGMGLGLVSVVLISLASSGSPISREMFARLFKLSQDDMAALLAIYIRGSSDTPKKGSRVRLRIY